ncbi:phenylalanine--tRNA ligase subunit alpha [Candidatus Microgenomates bacterium]|nr:phenylalanine--tRNA ligase subunit alpha [Candidatus Microgenomates bacterium]
MISNKDIESALKEVAKADKQQAVEKLRLKYLGRGGVITKALRGVGALPPAKRAAAGKLANQAKNSIEQAIARRVEELEQAQIEKVAERPLDLTAPAPGPRLGHLHPVQSLQQELIQVFWQLGFSVAEGPEVETDWYNFEALNIAADHPARDMQDTFYLESGAVVRTHTSPVQIRYMEEHKPPIRIIAPGKTYRNEDEDATHLWAFHQVEGLVVDERVTLADLKGTLTYMLQAIFGTSAKLRLVPSYFPYTEPSLEVLARLNDEADWLELAGAGMVHPKVLRNVGIDPDKYSGFAFGIGLERIAAIKYGVSDIRYFWRPNLRFLEQF